MGAVSSTAGKSSVHDFTVKVFKFFLFVLHDHHNFKMIRFTNFFNRYSFDFGFDFEMQDSRGKDVDLSIYKGKVLLIVNVASKWFVSRIIRFDRIYIMCVLIS